MQEVCGVHFADFHRGVYLVSDVFAAAEHEVNFGGHLFRVHAVAAVVARYFNDGAVADGGVGVGYVLALHGFPAIDFRDEEEGHIVIGDFVDAEERVVVRVNCAVYLASRLDFRRAVVMRRRGLVRDIREGERHRVCAEVVGGVGVFYRADILREALAVAERGEVDRRIVVAAIGLHFACAIGAEPIIHKLYDFGVVGSRVGRVESGVSVRHFDSGEESGVGVDFAGVFDGRHGAVRPGVFGGGSEGDIDNPFARAVDILRNCFGFQQVVCRRRQRWRNPRPRCPSRCRANARWARGWASCP